MPHDYAWGVTADRGISAPGQYFAYIYVEDRGDCWDANGWTQGSRHYTSLGWAATEAEAKRLAEAEDARLAQAKEVAAA